jgi:hypothetical protein
MGCFLRLPLINRMTAYGAKRTFTKALMLATVEANQSVPTSGW